MIRQLKESNVNNKTYDITIRLRVVDRSGPRSSFYPLSVEVQEQILDAFVEIVNLDDSAFTLVNGEIEITPFGTNTHEGVKNCDNRSIFE